MAEGLQVKPFVEERRKRWEGPCALAVFTNLSQTVTAMVASPRTELAVSGQAFIMMREQVLQKMEAG